MNKSKQLTMEQIKQIEIDILKYIDKVCRDNNINYTVIGGTLIGAVRHLGFIPWDDDIDIALRREDYNRLKELFKDNDKYTFLDADNASDYYYPYGKIVDKNTKLIENGFKEIEQMGVYIDVFPLDQVKRNKCKFKIKYLRFLLNLKNCGVYESKYESNEQLKYKLSRLIKPFINTRKINNRIINISQKGNDKNYKYEGMISIGNGQTKYIFEKQMYDEYIDLPFEQIQIMSVKDYDKYLRQIFGDYMKLPPKDQQVPKHNFKAYYREK